MEKQAKNGREGDFLGAENGHLLLGCEEGKGDGGGGEGGGGEKKYCLPSLPILNLRRENITSTIPQQLSLTAASDSVDVFSGSAGAEGDDEINCSRGERSGLN